MFKIKQITLKHIVNYNKYIIEATLKSKKIKNATKTPRHNPDDNRDTKELLSIN